MFLEGGIFILRRIRIVEENWIVIKNEMFVFSIWKDFRDVVLEVE